MSGNTNQAAASAPLGANQASGRPVALPMQPATAMVWGVVLLLVTGVGSVTLTGLLAYAVRHGGANAWQLQQVPIGFGVLVGVVMLLVSIAGLVLLFRALDLADGSAAFALPSGSIRALLALGLVVVFVAVASTVLLEGANPSDQAKQILAIAGTALSTVVGFYFGSNAATAAASNMADALQQQANSPVGTSTPAATVLSPTDIAQKVTAIRSLATAATAGRDGLGDPSLDALTAELAAAGNPAPPAGSPGLDQARDAFGRLTQKLAACATDADRAEAALKDWQATGSDPSKLGALADRIAQLSTDCTAANHDFMTALADYTAARDALMKSVAKG
jgi:hypothetical protein